MTSKEALAVLYRFHDAVGDWSLHHDHNQEAQQRKSEIMREAYRALLYLTPAIHGEALLHLSSFLCERCYLRYAELRKEGELLCSTCQVETEKQAAASAS